MSSSVTRSSILAVAASLETVTKSTEFRDLSNEARTGLWTTFDALNAAAYALPDLPDDRTAGLTPELVAKIEHLSSCRGDAPYQAGRKFLEATAEFARVNPDMAKKIEGALLDMSV